MGQNISVAQTVAEIDNYLRIGKL